MKKIFPRFTHALQTTPFLGRTLVVLSFFFLIIKQIFLVVAYKQVFTEATTGATLLHYLGYAVSDGIVYVILLGYMLINILIKNKIIKTINIVIIACIFLLFVIDVFTMGFMQSRLSILDLNQFIGSSLTNFSWMVVWGFFILGILGIITFLFVQRPRFVRHQKKLIAASLLLFAAICLRFGISAPQGSAQLPDNIISLNISAFGEHFPNRGDGSAQSYAKFFKKVPGSAQHPNIIVVFAESLSPIDSKLIGGKQDNLPYFDLIQKQGITFSNFINNGCTSDTAHIGLFLGVEPLKLRGQQMTSYSGYTTLTPSLPAFFAQQGYTSIFVSAVDLDFLDQRDFLSGAGFGSIIDENAFTGEEKYVFDAAPDMVLYDKTLNVVAQQDSPYFLSLQTISFHKPYNTPYGKNQEDALRYSDKSLYYFYLQLKKSGFFDNGLLVIVGDHRKMEPLEEGEKEALGEYRYTRGLATIVGTGITGGTVNNNIVQQTDLFYGLKQLVGKGTITVSKIFNTVFAGDTHRDRGITYCRYFQNSNKYSLVFEHGSGAIFNEISQIAHDYPLIHKYLSSYIAFEEGTGNAYSGARPMTIIAHQGSPLDAPENSLEGFLLAKSHEADGIEMDISYTKDHHNIVMHGERTRASVCGKNTLVYKSTLDDLKTKCPLKNGESIMTLEEILSGTKGLFDYYFVDIKVYDTSDAEQQVLDAVATVQKLGMQDKVIFTSYDKTATYILGSTKDIIAGRDTYNLSELNILPNMNHQYYMMPQNLITATTPQEVEDIGKKLVIYTVNTTGDAQKLYNEGVRMIMTDDVPLMKERVRGLSQ